MECRSALHRRLAELIGRPMSMGNIEEAGIIAGLLCSLEQLKEEQTFTVADAREWVEHMENADGTTGEHWTPEETAQLPGAERFRPWVWWAAVNMMYSDYSGVIQKYGMHRPEIYADLAAAFLDDKDGGGAERKMAAYWRGVANRQ